MYICFTPKLLHTRVRGSDCRVPDLSAEMLTHTVCHAAENQVLQIVLKDHDRVLGDTEIGRWGPFV